MIKTHSFRGKVYNIVEGPSEGGGLCDHPKTDTKETIIPVGGDKLYDLDTIIHESLHACLWDLNEDAVEDTATSVARLLWRLGWRKEP